VDGKGFAPRAMRRGDDPQIAAHGDTILVLWAVPGPGWGGSGPFTSAISRDGGKTWSSAATPSDSGLKTGHGFADLVAQGGDFHAVWLDSRPKHQGLRYSHSRDGAAWSRNETIAGVTCECCWNSLHTRDGKLEVLYRAKDPRDMALAVRDTRWRKSGSVGAFDWRVKGCPETGGALASTSDSALHALVWTGQEGEAGLYHLASKTRVEWSAPQRIGGPEASHSDLAARGNTLAAVWDENGAVYASVSPDAGASWGVAQRISAPSGDATNPRIVTAREGFLAAWTQRGAGGVHELALHRLR
jgi:hypothetical protein